MQAVSTNPATLLGFGTWTAFGAGRVMVGFDSGNALFDTAEETGGSADATLANTHSHSNINCYRPGSLACYWHRYKYNFCQAIGRNGGIRKPNAVSASPVTNTTGSSITGISVSNASTGSSGTNANYQPYITVYMWKRTA
jgi:hypothetical protein